MKPITKHIEDNHGGNKAAFARAVGVVPQMVTQWVKKGFWVTVEGYIINPKNTRCDRSHIRTPD